MFDRTAEPIEHKPPYRRIGINEAPPADPNISAGTAVEMIDDTLRRQDAPRIWGLVVQTAEGTNAPMPMPAMSA